MTQAFAEEQVPGAAVQSARKAAERVVEKLRGTHGTIATAESLTAGLVAAALAEVPGVSEWFLGGVVAYSYEVKAKVLGVSEAMLESQGAVTQEVALAMAHGAAERIGARWAVATTGVAGPGPADGQPQGTVWIAAVDAVTGATVTQLHHFDGTRDAVRWDACRAALGLLADIVEQNRTTQR